MSQELSSSALKNIYCLVLFAVTPEQISPGVFSVSLQDLLSWQGDFQAAAAVGYSSPFNNPTPNNRAVSRNLGFLLLKSCILTSGLLVLPRRIHGDFTAAALHGVTQGLWMEHCTPQDSGDPQGPPPLVGTNKQKLCCRSAGISRADLGTFPSAPGQPLCFL